MSNPMTPAEVVAHLQRRTGPEQCNISTEDQEAIRWALAEIEHLRSVSAAQKSSNLKARIFGLMDGFNASSSPALKEVEAELATAAGLIESLQRERDSWMQIAKKESDAAASLTAENSALKDRHSEQRGRISELEEAIKLTDDAYGKLVIQRDAFKEERDGLAWIVRQQQDYLNHFVPCPPVFDLPKSVAQVQEFRKKAGLLDELDIFSGVVYDGLILLRQSALDRKSQNGESTSDERVTSCEEMMQAIANYSTLHAAKEAENATQQTNQGDPNDTE